MLKSVLILLVVGIVSATSALAITLDEIVAKNIEKRGGRAAIEAIKTVKATGTMSIMMGGNAMDMSMITLFKRDNKMKMTQTMQGTSMITAFDGKNGWSINPMSGSDDPTKLPGEANGELESQARFDGELLNYAKNGFTASYEGLEDVEDSPAYKIKLVHNTTKAVSYVYVDATTFLEVLLVSVTGSGDEMMETKVYVLDNITTNGIVFPKKYKVVTGPTSPTLTMTYTKVEMNVPIADSEFAFPGK